jgi:hypothetical protein
METASFTGSQLQFYGLGAGLMHQTTLYHSALLHFDLVVLDIPCDTCRRQEFKRFTSEHRSNHGSVDNHVADGDCSFYAGFLADNQRAFLTILAADIAPHLAVYAQASGKTHISLDTCTRTDEAIYTTPGGFALFDTEHEYLRLKIHGLPCTQAAIL